MFRSGVGRAACIGALCVAIAGEAIAQTATERGVTFLLESSDARGSWGAAREETSLRDTATALRALATLGLDASPEYAAGLAWLAEERRRNTDDTARAVAALRGTSLAFRADDDRSSLLEARIPAGGWGLAFGDGVSAPLDSALVALALFPEIAMDEPYDVLVSIALEQNVDGGWGADLNESLFFLAGLTTFAAALTCSGTLCFWVGEDLNFELGTKYCLYDCYPWANPAGKFVRSHGPVPIQSTCPPWLVIVSPGRV